MAERKSFGSDNHARADEAVLRAVIEANTGDAVAYGDDEWTRRATAELRLRFRARAMSSWSSTARRQHPRSEPAARSHDAVICAESSHLNVDECGAAERVLGNKLLTVPRRTASSLLR